MADTKISGLTALTGANVDQTADVLPIVDTSATTTKKIIVNELGKALNVLSTEQATTSGTSIDFTGIPAGVKRITIMFVGVSTNGSSELLIQTGDSGGIETTGYTSTAFSSAAVSSTSGFIVSSATAAAATVSGLVTLNLENSSNFTMVASGVLKLSTGNVTMSAGDKATSAELDRIRLTTVNGSDTFDAGAVNISYGW